MRIALLMPLFCLLAACSVVPPQAWSFDPSQAPARTLLPSEQLAPLTNRVAQLQIERNEIRARIAGERDVSQRLREYGDLHRVGMELSVLERRLAVLAPG